MSVRMRHTSSHTKNRRSHHALVEQGIVVDKNSGALRLPHTLDESTGMYRGIQIVSKKEVKKVDKKKKEKAKKHEHEEVATTNTTPAGEKHTKNDEREKKQGLIGRMTLGKAKSRSGFGGGV